MIGTKIITRSNLTNLFHCEESECAERNGWSGPRDIRYHYTSTHPNHPALAEREQAMSCKRARDLNVVTEEALPRKRHRGDGGRAAMIPSAPDNSTAYDADSHVAVDDDDSESGSSYNPRDAKKTTSVTNQAQFYRSRTAVEPSDLRPLCLAVDRGVIICSRCNFGIQRRNIRTHLFKTHPDLRTFFPAQNVIDKALDDQKVPPALSEKIPPARVGEPPLPFIPVTFGWKCLSHHCVHATRMRDSLVTHIYRVHKGISSKTLVGRSYVQMVYTSSPKSFWAVNLDSVLLVDDEPLHQAAVEEALQLLVQDDEDGTIRSPPSDNHMTPFLADSGWAALCRGKDVKSLINMGQRALDDEGDDSAMFLQAAALVKRYFSVVIGEVKRFDYKAGCWINTPEGYVGLPYKNASMHLLICI